MHDPKAVQCTARVVISAAIAASSPTPHALPTPETCAPNEPALTLDSTGCIEGEADILYDTRAISPTVIARVRAGAAPEKAIVSHRLASHATHTIAAYCSAARRRASHRHALRLIPSNSIPPDTRHYTSQHHSQLTGSHAARCATLRRRVTRGLLHRTGRSGSRGERKPIKYVRYWLVPL